MLGQARFCRGTGGNLGICHKSAQVCRTHAEFFLGKTGTVCLFNKKIQGYMFKPGQFQGKQSKLPRFLFHKDNLSRYHRLQLHASLNSYQDLHPDLILRAPTKLPNILLTGKSLNTLLYPQEIMTYLDRL